MLTRLFVLARLNYLHRADLTLGNLNKQFVVNDWLNHLHSKCGDSTLTPWSVFGREVGGEDCFGEPPLEFSTEGTFVQKLLDLEDGELDGI